MSVEYKICNNCGNKVETDYNFCPNCKSQSFRSPNAPVRAQNTQPNIIRTLFYWRYGDDYILSKSKVIAICVFLPFIIFAIESGITGGMIVVGLIFSALTYVIGLALHQIKGKPSDAQIKYNEYGLLQDVIHLFFYWQNKKTGEFVIAKTKVISCLVFLFFFLMSLMLEVDTILAALIFALIFEIPAFAIGFAFHKLTNPNPVNPPKVDHEKPKEVKPVKKPVEKPEAPKPPEKSREFQEYEKTIKEMQEEFDEKQKVARDLIEKRFQPPQLTYTKFISLVDKSKEIFDREVDSTLTIINLASEDSPRIDSELKSKIEVLKSIITRMDDLTSELVLSMDKSDDSDIDNLIEDMEEIIGSVKDY